jgi:hypothetical protein
MKSTKTPTLVGKNYFTRGVLCDGQCRVQSNGILAALDVMLIPSGTQLRIAGFVATKKISCSVCAINFNKRKKM